MGEYDLTLSRAAMPELLEQPAALGKLVETILNQVFDARIISAPSLRTLRRTRGLPQWVSRAGRATRVGSLTLRVPQTRDGRFSTDIFERYRRSEQAFVLGLMEMVINGVSTRKV